MSPTACTAMVRHAAPVMLNKKPAALFTLLECRNDLTELAKTLSRKGMRVRQMRKYQGKVLLLVYHPGLLAHALAHPLASRLLAQHGYQKGGSLGQILRHLQARMAMQQDFPHEIGLFLGYPPEDVAGFIRHRGDCYKLCGKWKVYSDVERAKALFYEYDRCSECLQRHLNNGGKLSDFAEAIQPEYNLEALHG